MRQQTGQHSLFWQIYFQHLQCGSIVVSKQTPSPKTFLFKALNQHLKENVQRKTTMLYEKRLHGPHHLSPSWNYLKHPANNSRTSVRETLLLRGIFVKCMYTTIYSLLTVLEAWMQYIILEAKRVLLYLGVDAQHIGVVVIYQHQMVIKCVCVCCNASSGDILVKLKLILLGISEEPRGVPKPHFEIHIKATLNVHTHTHTR